MTAAHRASQDLVRGAATWRRAVLGGASAWAFSRVLVTTVAMVSQWAATGLFLGGRPFVDLLAQWDSVHLAEIARHGYDADSTNTAFFPGYPLAARAVATLLGPWSPDPVALALAVVAGIGGLVASVLLWRLVDTSSGVRAAEVATALFVLGPYAVFLHASYAESCFAAAAIGAWYAATRDRWLLAGVLTAVAGAIRPNGLFLLAAIVVLYVVRRRAAGRRLVAWPALGLATGVAGFLGYMLYLWTSTGRWDTWSRAQGSGWGRRIQAPWDTFSYTVQSVAHHEMPSAQPQFLLDIVFAGLLLAAIAYFLVHRSWAEAVFLVITAVSLMTSSTYVSLARNTLPLFPIWVALGAASVRHATGRRVALVVLVVGVALCVANTHQFTLGEWAD
ncbi:MULTISPECIES: mannosyltransferase family protein [unclassified Curtobacterium]|uniref:mannosyltransferase family protein n=1 Tax=unclassified Curtobacterium TaxID=257496 RepID=UPI0008257897|nr:MULTISPECIES: mannosyltransferase family protein [unclassified Curtobacterium]WIB01015.1 mannosyltransferase family protein [Curtobacterium sp. MCBA15_012]